MKSIDLEDEYIMDDFSEEDETFEEDADESNEESEEDENNSPDSDESYLEEDEYDYLCAAMKRKHADE